MSQTAIAELGERIEKVWAARNRDQKVFPDLCIEELQRAGIHERVSPDSIVRWALSSDLPSQYDPEANFGQPPITIYRGSDFFISALFWTDGTTAIHDHGFSGAFQVLSGSSIETTFDFNAARQVGSMRFGELVVRGTTLRRAGDMAPIYAGPRFIHSLFHLDRPSVSLVVRTPHDSGVDRQLRYHKAGIAHPEPDENGQRQSQIVQMLIETDNPDLQQYVSVSMENPDLSRAFETVRACSRIRDGRLQEALLQCVRDSDAAECFRRWLSQERRLTLLRRARGDVKDPALRFLLAVLLNAHTRSDAMALVAGHGSTSEPGRQVAAWLSQLSTIVFQLQVGNLPVQANVLGLPTFEQGFEQALANALDGSRGPESEAERQFLARLSELPVLSPLFA